MINIKKDVPGKTEDATETQPPRPRAGEVATPPRPCYQYLTPIAMPDLPTDRPIRVDIYRRVSTLDQAQEGYSLEAQERILLADCAAKGYVVHGNYADAGISGKDMVHRPALQAVLDDVRNDRVDVVMVWALSRFSRSVADLYHTLDLLQRHKVNLISHTEAFDTTTPTGRAMVGVLGVFAQWEREITAERVAMAMAERAAHGLRNCAYVLGYDVTRGIDRMTINPTEALIVQYIYDAYTVRQSITDVTDLCRARGYRGKRGGPLRTESVHKILTRPVYCGYHSYHGRPYPGTHDPIIDVDHYNLVQCLLTQAGDLCGRRRIKPLLTLEPERYEFDPTRILSMRDAVFSRASGRLKASTGPCVTTML